MTSLVARASVALGLVLGGPAAAAGQHGSPAGPVPVARLEARRAALAERLDGGVAALRSAEERSVEGDYPQDSDYRESNDFFYLTGLERPGGWLVVGPAGRMVLYLPERDPAQEQWTGPKLGPGAEATEWSGIGDVRPASALRAELGALLGSSEVVYTEPAILPLVDSLAGPGVELRDVREETAALRLVKDADEIARLRRAIDITAEALRTAMQAVEPGWWEYEIEALVEYTFRRRGAERVGFPSIVGSGPNSTVLHYDKNRRQTEAGDLVVADVGAEFGYYTADVTRTFPVSGRFTDRQRALYRLVLGAQQAAIDAVRPGVTVGELNRIAREYMRTRSGALCGAVACDRFFVHGLSHWLGMDVHDVGVYGTPLRPGMVLTIEPGLYLPDEEIGIRIEDDVLVTEHGAEILSADVPREPEAIERLMSGPAALPAGG